MLRLYVRGVQLPWKPIYKKSNDLQDRHKFVTTQNC